MTTADTPQKMVLHATTQYTLIGDTLDNIEISGHHDHTHIYVTLTQYPMGFTLAVPTAAAIPLLRRMLHAAVRAHDAAVMPHTDDDPDTLAAARERLRDDAGRVQELLAEPSA